MSSVRALECFVVIRLNAGLKSQRVMETQPFVIGVHNILLAPGNDIGRLLKQICRVAVPSNLLFRGTGALM